MSDLLIRGMELPSEINPDNYIELGYGIDGKSYARLYNFHFGGLTEWCEIIPVPPHGRLGDLDALAKQVEHERFHHAHTDGLAARHHVAEYGHFLKAIVDTPTIIPASEELT